MRVFSFFFQRSSVFKMDKTEKRTANICGFIILNIDHFAVYRQLKLRNVWHVRKYQDKEKWMKEWTTKTHTHTHAHYVVHVLAIANARNRVINEKAPPGWWSFQSYLFRALIYRAPIECVFLLKYLQFNDYNFHSG